MAVRHKVEIFGMLRIFGIIGIIPKLPKISTISIILFLLLFNFRFYLNDLLALVRAAEPADAMG